MEEEKLNEKIKDGRSGPIIVLLIFIAIVNDVQTLVTVDMILKCIIIHKAVYTSEFYYCVLELIHLIFTHVFINDLEPELLLTLITF